MARDKEKKRVTNKKHAQTPGGRYSVLRSHTITNGKSFTLTKEEYIELTSNPCYYCNYELGTPVKEAGGLDRLDIAKGYEPNNCVSCCRTCNTLRFTNLTPEETKIVVRTIIDLRADKTINLPQLDFFDHTNATMKLNEYLISSTPPVPRTRHSERPSCRYFGCKSRSKTRGLEFNLSKEEYYSLIREPCYYCEYLLGDPVRTAIGLDRLDTTKDYELGNVVSCCMFCNQMKNDILTPDETKIVVRAILNYRLQAV